ncbi:hypothetical protein Cgig2_012895 [Carnegiea gigantea]|uniref:ferroxidase n=1 Tax=Carnegiea gigantea TaxID=171969 RepID=A0A9Q1JYG4_9CARY|nr:hypothetical protein Cgig2_012895 [Carnegiea gigantea]
MDWGSIESLRFELGVIRKIRVGELASRIPASDWLRWKAGGGRPEVATKGRWWVVVVRKNIDELTCQLLNVRSKSRWTPLSKVHNPGFATGVVPSISSRSFCSHPSDAFNELQGPAAIDYRSVLQEDEFHKLADSTIHDLLEKLEQYGDSIDLDGFDIDYGNEVLTMKLGDLGTYVVNKQTPNRQIWLSSPVSGPSRYDWDRNTQAWIYRRTRANLLRVLESEIEELCGKPLNLS